MEIKKEYLGKTLTKSDSVLGKFVLKVDESCLEKYTMLVSMGFGYIFEKEKQPKSEPVEIIEEVFTESIEPEVKPTKKRKKNANTEQ